MQITRRERIAGCRDRFADESFVRKIASPDRIVHGLPPGESRIVEE